MARCNCSPRCHVCGDGPCDCTCTAADRKAHLAQPAQAVDVEKVREERDSQQRAAIAAIDRAERAEALLRECDEVARKRGDRYGLCDAIDNTGQPYQSQFLADYLAHLSENSRG